MSRFVTFKFVGHHHSRSKTLLLQKLMEKTLGSLGISMPLHKDVEHVALGIYRSPKVVLLSLDRDNNLIEMPFISKVGTFAPHLVGISLPKLLTPFPN